MMSFRKLIHIELKKFDVNKFFRQALLAIIGIACLVLMTSFFMELTNEELPIVTTVAAIDALVKAVFVVWQSVLIANIIIEEFRSKTIFILFSYPVDRKEVIIGKLFLIFFLIFGIMIVSQVILNVTFFMLDKIIPVVHYHITLKEVGTILFTTTTSVLLGMLPMYVGMLNKSTVATVVSSIAIVSLTVSSGAEGGSGLITIIPISTVLGITGGLFAYTAIKKMLTEDVIL